MTQMMDKEASGIFLEGLSNGRALVLGISIVGISILKYGLGYVRWDTYRQLAENPFVTLPLKSNYFQASPLTSILAYYLGLTAKYPFAFFLLSILILAWLILIWLSIGRLGPKYGLFLTALLSSHPLIVVLQTWIGMPDAISFMLIVAAIFAKDWRAWVMISFLGALNHPSLYFAVPAILLLRSVNPGWEIGRRQALASSVGLGMGLLLTRIYLHIHGIQLESRAEFILNRGLDFWVRMNLNQLPYLLFSLNGPLWLAIGGAIFLFFRMDRRFYSLYLAILVVSYCVTFFTLDNTRVFGLLTIGATIVLFIRSFDLVQANAEAAIEEEQFGKLLVGYAVIALVFPNFYTWEGRIQAPSFLGFYRGLHTRIGNLLFPNG